MHLWKGTINILTARGGGVQTAIQFVVRAEFLGTTHGFKEITTLPHLLHKTSPATTVPGTFVIIKRGACWGSAGNVENITVQVAVQMNAGGVIGASAVQGKLSAVMNVDRKCAQTASTHVNIAARRDALIALRSQSCVVGTRDVRLYTVATVMTEVFRILIVVTTVTENSVLSVGWTIASTHGKTLAQNV